MGLTTISSNTKAKTEIFEQLSSIIGDQVVIRSLSYDELDMNEKVVDDAILITTPVLKAKVEPYLHPACKCLVGKRTINPKQIYSLFSIPPGSEVLVVNLIFESAQDFITELHTIGVNHVKFFPYDNNKPLDKEFKYAITPGEAHLVPPGIPNVIDVGNRFIDIVTIAEILFYLTGSASCYSLLISRYIQDFVKVSMELTEQDMHNELLRLQMAEVIANIEDGVILTDLNRKITFHNNMALEILGCQDLIGKSINEVFAASLSGECIENVTFFEINGKGIYATFKEMIFSDKKKTEMIILKDITKIRSIDEQYRKENKYSGHNAKYTFSNILYKSTRIKELIEKAKNLAKTNASILITGESGTGKELFAQSIHNASLRKGLPFIAINCAALSESLLESELFGYEEGAFTGAKKGGKKGLFELAHMGTIFLDEVGDAPYSIQKKLLRVLQEKEIMRVSGDKTIPVDVRVIAATNKNLRELVEKGEFREDLYYRLNVFPIYIPSLKERKEDIEILFRYFLNVYASVQNRTPPQSNKELTDILLDYSWPGNIRQLENVAEYMVTISSVSNNIIQDIKTLLGFGSMAERQGIVNESELSFKNKEIKNQAVAILQILAEEKNKEILLGRFLIRQKLYSKGLNLSEQQIKSRLETLKRFKLINSEIGKGSSISLKGMHYLLREQG